MISFRPISDSGIFDTVTNPHSFPFMDGMGLLVALGEDCITLSMLQYLKDQTSSSPSQYRLRVVLLPSMCCASSSSF